MDQYYISHLVFPEDRYMDSFLINEMQPVFVTDANPNIRHMSWYVESPAAILSLYDAISYPKGTFQVYFVNDFMLNLNFFKI